ncbi:hypothetical protein [Pleurocapsa sp. FMAR1]|uniref:hypothetical protein n=1 Tax=Pleurocapsa sp. FMAR1 TaxID=3040204 RepID=UPI0029C69608|nr:hypothetical protein [Pleurocapsa sp. FMAR1]
MMESSIKKDIILNGTDSIAVFKEDGLVYRAKDLESYTPIVLGKIEPNTSREFKLLSAISKDYLVLEMNTDVVADDNPNAMDENTANNYNYANVNFTILREGKRVLSQIISLNAGNISTRTFLISPLDTLKITSSQALNSITLICQPVYLEKTIFVPEVITDEPVIS